MGFGLDWINDLILWFARWLPRWELCEPTHRGVKVKGGFVSSIFGRTSLTVQKIEPGIYWWWPVKTLVKLLPVERHSVDLPTQSIDTRDGKPIMVSAVLVIEIADIVKALTKSPDISDTIMEIGGAAATTCVACRTYSELRKDFAEGDVEEELLKEARLLLRRYGVRVVDARLLDCVKHFPIRNEGGGAVSVPTEAMEE
jgi:regulator of protease activity HflC (stomatin/prohibitin superfamily)